MSDMPPAMDEDRLSDPPEPVFPMPDDPFAGDSLGREPLGLDYAADDDPFTPFPAASLPVSDDAAAPTPPSFAPDDGWGWHDAALIAVERTAQDGEGTTFAVGMVDLYANVRTGDLGGSYLEIGAFEALDEAAGFYHALQGEVHTRMLLPFQMGDFAADKAHERAAEREQPAPAWRTAGPAEYAAYEQMRALNASPVPDLPHDDLDFDTMFAPEAGPARPAPGADSPTFKALREIGIAADGFDPEADPPPFVDPETGTAYWIGVFHPDKADPSGYVTSILSVGRDPVTGDMQAALAPVVPGDWDKAYGAAEYLLGVIEKDGLERCIEAAERMALASGQRELWETADGIPLEQDVARDLADYTRNEWEIEL